MRILILFFFILLVKGVSAQVKTIKQSSPSASTTTLRARAPGNTAADSVMSDINTMFGSFSQSLEMEFARLTREYRNKIDAINAQIKQIDAQVAALRAEKAKLDSLNHALSARLPQGSQRAEVGLDSIRQQLAMVQRRQTVINNQLSVWATQRAELQRQLTELQRNNIALDAEKQKMVASLEQTKQKALAEALKTREQNPAKYQEVLITLNSNLSQMLNDQLQAVETKYGVR